MPDPENFPALQLDVEQLGEGETLDPIEMEGELDTSAYTEFLRDIRNRIVNEVDVGDDEIMEKAKAFSIANSRWTVVTDAQVDAL